MSRILIGLLSVFAYFVPLQAYQYKVAVTAIFQNEARFLREWIEYYKLLGVDHFYLYNNLSDDDFLAVLAPYIKAGEVELYQWEFEPNDWKEWDEIQTNAYRHALAKAKKKAKWLAIVDTDEFIVPITGASLPFPLQKFLKHYESDSKIGGLCLPWVFFGTSHVQTISKDQLLLEMLTLNGGAACGGDSLAILGSGQYKSIVRPKYVKKVNSPHSCIYVKKRRHILVDFTKAQLNHYWTRDESFFYGVKIPRRSKWGQAVDEVILWADGMNHETAYSDPVFKFVPALKKRMGVQ